MLFKKYIPGVASWLTKDWFIHQSFCLH